eukprot:977418-Amphidinium_carterae.1
MQPRVRVLLQLRTSLHGGQFENRCHQMGFVHIFEGKGTVITSVGDSGTCILQAQIRAHRYDA